MSSEPLTENEFAILKSLDEGPVPWQVDQQLLARRMAWEMSPCNIAKEVAAKMGLPDASEDVDEMEHRAAHARLTATAPVAQMLSVVNQTAAHVIRAGMLVVHGDAIEQNPLMTHEALYSILMQGAVASIAELADMGLIGLPPMPQQQVAPHV
jgi:hypothetical protein